MLSRTFEWTRVTNPSPDDGAITKRRATVEAVLEALTTDDALLPDIAIAAVTGVEGQFSQESELATTMIAAIRAQQPAYPESVTENALDLQVCCALVAGEKFRQIGEEGALPTDTEQYALSLTVSALGYRPLSGQKYLREMLVELRDVAVNSVQTVGKMKRKRGDAAKYIRAIKAPAEVAAFWTGAQEKFLAAFETLEDNAAIDREELDIFWWAHNGQSRSGRSFASLDQASAALSAGVELADLVLLPQLQSTSLLLRKVISESREPHTIVERPLKDLLLEAGEGLTNAFSYENEIVVEQIRAHPRIFPLSWIGLRQRDVGKDSWVGEFKKKTGWDPKTSMLPEILSMQAYSERVAHRVIEASK